MDDVPPSIVYRQKPEHYYDQMHLGFVKELFPRPAFVMLSRSEASLVREAEILRSGCGLRSG
jgi:hypothetical protein